MSSLILDNPIFVRELRRRMRGRGLIITMILYIAAMCGFGYMIIATKSAQVIAQQAGYTYSYWGGRTHTTVSDIGQALFSSILMIQSILVLIVAPTITAAMVKSEKERQTFDFLRVTTLSAPTYIVGALLSTVLYVALALFCALPILTIAYLYGGVSNILQMALLLLAGSIVLSSVGLLVSCVSEKYGAGQSSAAVVAVAFIVLLLFASRLLSMFSATSGPFLTSPVAGTGLEVWQVLVVAALVVSGLFLLIAARKLYRPEERALNYRQSAGVLAFSVVTVVSIALSLPGARFQPAAIAHLLLVGTAVPTILICNNALFTRVDIGNERWRLKKTFPQLRNLDESFVFCIAVVVASSLVCFVAMRGIGWDSRRAMTGIAPAFFFLVGRVFLSRILMKRISGEFRALRLSLALDALLLLGPLLVVWLSKSIFAVTAGQAFYPLHPGDGASESYRIALFGAMAILFCLVDLRTADRHENTHVNYELAL